jgi:hypothetical protein
MFSGEISLLYNYTVIRYTQGRSSNRTAHSTSLFEVTESRDHPAKLLIFHAVSYPNFYINNFVH